ncbi:hypothetical protein NT2_05_02290 [Caenibius tardaugens NBRC 16725]|uniref:Uncharacterized protein n=1 Tax=Caenibius tardaugens NBRC 16725 TaxID=1219035 RepID=U2ZVC9_9SPHN|nr:hypothetical protein NT2_05_02290 [Caenibius tardaugens NBRC 16725]
MADVPIIDRAMAAAINFFMVVSFEICGPQPGHEEKLPRACRRTMPGRGQLVIKCNGLCRTADRAATIAGMPRVGRGKGHV